MRVAGRVAAEILDGLAPLVRPGMTTGDIDAVIEAEIARRGAIAATMGYQGYGYASCISVNHVICHGVPGPQTLNEGDTVNIDITVVVDGWHADSGRMYLAGRPSPEALRLVRGTHDALMRAISVVRPGATFGDIGHAIESHASAQGLSVVRDFCGHGIGRAFHAPPHVLNYGRPGSGAVLEEGMFFTIEPMLTLGRPESRILSDHWTVVTRDMSRAAQFEHTVGVTARGCEIFTRSPAGRFCPALAGSR